MFKADELLIFNKRLRVFFYGGRRKVLKVNYLVKRAMLFPTTDFPAAAEPVVKPSEGLHDLILGILIELV